MPLTKSTISSIFVIILIWFSVIETAKAENSGADDKQNTSEGLQENIIIMNNTLDVTLVLGQTKYFTDFPVGNRGNYYCDYDVRDCPDHVVFAHRKAVGFIDSEQCVNFDITATDKATPGNYTFYVDYRYAHSLGHGCSIYHIVTINLTITFSETVSTPDKPTGVSEGKVGQELFFETGGAISNFEHDVEYQFNWGDGTELSWGPARQSHRFGSPGIKYVIARARCQTHTSMVSDWSGLFSVSILPCSLITSVSPSGSGTINRNPDKIDYNYLETAELMVTANSGYQFDHWEGDLSGSGNPGTISMNGVKNVTACFTETTETVSIPNAPEGPSSGKAGQELGFQTEGAASTLGHDVEYQFDWGDGTQSGWGAASQDFSFSSTGTKYVRVRARCKTHTSIVSDWSDTSSVLISLCELTTNISPDSLGSISRYPDKTDYSYNEPVELWVAADSGYQFDHWEGDLSGSGNPDTIIMNDVKSVTAYFIKTTETVSIPFGPYPWTNGKVGETLSFNTRNSSSNMGHPVEYQFDWGDSTLSSWGPAEQSHIYNSAGLKYVRARARCQIHKSIVSGWSSQTPKYIYYCYLVIKKGPSGAGSVKLTPDKTVFVYNENVQLKAVANTGFAFDHWEGLSGNVNPKNITMTKNREITAYFTAITDVTSESDDIKSIKFFALDQNYPNPFNPETTIDFQLPKSSHVKITIYNLTGQLVKTLVDGYHTAGAYQVTWQPDGLASGIYLCRLKAGDYVETKKLIFQK